MMHADRSAGKTTDAEGLESNRQDEQSSSVAIASGSLGNSLES
jgi:hypothetical protein